MPLGSLDEKCEVIIKARQALNEELEKAAELYPAQLEKLRSANRRP